MATKRLSVYVPACWYLTLIIIPSLHGLALAAEEAPRKLEVEGASLTYVPKDLPRQKRTPAGELSSILAATAHLTVSKPIGFRGVELPPGTYALRVEGEEGKSPSLVVEDVKPAPPAEKEGRNGGPEKGNGEKRSEKKPGMEADGGAGGGHGDAVEEPPSPEAKKAKSLHAGLTVGMAKDPENKVGFGLELADGGTRLRVLIRAGATEGRASLRFGERDARDKEE